MSQVGKCLTQGYIDRSRGRVLMPTSSSFHFHIASSHRANFSASFSWSCFQTNQPANQVSNLYMLPMSLGLWTLWQIMSLLSQSAIVTLTFWHRADVACMGESSFALWNLEFHFFHEKHLELVGQNCIFLGGSDPNSGAGWLRSRWCSKHAGSNTSREEVQASTGANPAARPAQPSLSAEATPALPAVSRLDQVQPLPS